MSPHSSRPAIARGLAVLLAVVLAVTGVSLPALADDDSGAQAPVIETTGAPTEPTTAATDPEATPSEPAEDAGAAVPEETEPDATARSLPLGALAAPDEGSSSTATPSVVVSKTTGLVAGEVITVTGTGFLPDAPATTATRPPIAGHFGGVYVAFGKFAATWKPSAGAPSSQRPTAAGQVRWFVDAADTGATGGTAIGADGSFSVDLTVTPVIANAIATGNFGVYTYPGGGASSPAFETYTPVAFAPTVVVSKTAGLVAGEVVTVTGAGYAPSTDTNATRPPIAGHFGGVYVAFGKFAATWKPSAGAPSSQRPTAAGQVRWFVDAADTGATGGTAINADGSFTTTLTVTPTITNAIADGNFGVYTYPGGGAAVARFETYMPMAFQAVTPTPTPTPTADPAAQTAGSLVWGVKASWRSYITGIAAGSISVAGGANGTGSGYSFPQSAATLDPAGLGSAAYRGSVTFRGHDGALDVRLADPVVRLTSATSGVLSVSTYGGRVDLATLALSAGSRQVDGTGAIVYSGVPVTLTAAGSTAFGGQYAAGTAFDPIGFTIGSTNGSNGSARVVAATTVTTTANTPDATPPATEGVASDETEFTEGAPATFTAGGFQPGESGILAVIYSEPTVLAHDLTADASGAVTWTGDLPTGLTGEHTFTFQGSVDRGIVIEIAAAEQVGCTVEGAVLDWGFKESFRAYIDGSIANGEWATADGASYATPLFTWAAGAGGYDDATGDADLAFTGSVRFTGHGGVLDTTIANPRVVIDGERAVLLLDVTGTTQSGEPVARTGVEFAALDLAAAERGGGGDLVAFSGIPATLTAAGAAAFGTYPEGEALDPVDLAITLDPACLEPVVAVDEPRAGTENASAASPLPWILGALVLLLVVPALIVVLVRRRRTA